MTLMEASPRQAHPGPSLPRHGDPGVNPSRVRCSFDSKVQGSLCAASLGLSIRGSGGIWRSEVSEPPSPQPSNDQARAQLATTRAVRARTRVIRADRPIGPHFATSALHTSTQETYITSTGVFGGIREFFIAGELKAVTMCAATTLYQRRVFNRGLPLWPRESPLSIERKYEV